MKFKKTLVALAALSAFGAIAQADPNAAEFKVSGEINPGIVNTESVTAAGVKTIGTTGKQNWKSGADFYFSGKTERVDGWAGIFMFELDADGVNNGVATSVGEIYGGFDMAGIGSLKLGSPNNLTLSAQAGRSPFGTKLGGGFSGNGAQLGLGQVRDVSSFVFKTESLGGLVIGIQGFADTVAAGSSTAANGAAAVSPAGSTKAGGGELAVVYTAAPVMVNLTIRNGGGAVGTATAPSRTINQKVLAVQFDYAEKGKLYVGYHNDTVTNDDNAGLKVAGTSNGWNLGVKQGVSDKMEVLFNYASKTDARDGTAGLVDQNIWALGLNYAHSAKLTSSVRYVQERNSGSGVYGTVALAPSAATAVESVRSMGYGLELKF